MRVIEHLVKTLRDSAIFNPEVQVTPTCILWPDKDRQWEAIIPRLQTVLPQLMVLGDYAKDKHTGPAIWLRCAIAHTLPDIELSKDQVPIIYLPGVGRQELRAVDACPDHLKPLAELQYRGVIWSQINAKDWTVLAFLKSDQGGLGLDVAQDSECKQAMLLALDKLLDEEVALLKGKRLDRDYFNTLLTGGDPIRDLLQWLDQGEVFRTGRSEAEWRAFVEVCSSQLGFSPQADGVMVGATRLANRLGPWQAVWSRFAEAPHRYPGIVSQIRRSPLPAFDFFTEAAIAGGWPQWNETQENELYKELVLLGSLPPHEARKQILALEQRHAERRALVWVVLGESSLAVALEHLAMIATITAKSLAVGSVKDMADIYREHAWRADDALLHALAAVEMDRDLEAVTIAIRSMYIPWADDSARHLQKVWNPLTDGIRESDRRVSYSAQTECILFVDGLRFDCGRRLLTLLQSSGLNVEERSVWAALPSVTGTGKYAVAPILRDNALQKNPMPYDFAPITNHIFKKMLVESGWQVLERKEVTTLHKGQHIGDQKTWCEFGDIDHEGHDRGWKLAKHIDGMINEIHGRILALLQAGCSSVRVVTDHGWLLLPGGLPKSELSASLVDTKWGRCASIKEGAHSTERLFPWYWNPEVEFALANGISCFKAGEEYTHGGLSLQECFNQELIVTGAVVGSELASANISDVVWKGMRCNLVVDCHEGVSISGWMVDIRRHAGDKETSIVVAIKPLKEGGTASVVVENEELQGVDVVAVVVDGLGTVLAQVDTKVGGDS